MNIHGSFLRNLIAKWKYIFSIIFLNFIFILYFFVSGQQHYTERYILEESEPIGLITDDIKIKQEFVSDSDGMTAIEIQFATYARQNDSNVFVKLTDAETDSIIFEEKIYAKNIADNAYRKFDFEKIPDSKNRKYVLHIKSDATIDNALTIWSGKGQFKNTTLFIGDKQVERTLNFTIHYLGIDKLKIILSLLAGIFGLLIVILIGNNTVCNFILLSLSFGFYFSVITPFYHAIDENSHFFRAYDVSQGNLFLDSQDGQVGSYLPKDVKKIKYEGKINELLRKSITINYDNKEFISSPIKYTSQYCFISYIPSAIGILIGRIFNFNLNIIGYVARLTNLIFYILIVSISIRTIPKGKNLLMAIALIPFQLLLSASLSLDGISSACIFLFIAICFRLHDLDNMVKNKDIVCLILLSLIITGAKNVGYAFVFMLFFMIHPSKFKNRKTYYISLTSGILSFFCLILIMKIFSPILVIDDRATGANALEQIVYLIHNPLILPYAIFHTLYLQFHSIFLSFQHGHFFGNNLGNNSTFIFPIFLFWLAKTDCYSTNRTVYLSNINKWLIILIIISNILIINLAMYIFFSPVGSITIEGSQGRYYFPLLALFLIMLNRNSYNIYDAQFNFKTAFILTLILNYNSLLLVKTMY